MMAEADANVPSVQSREAEAVFKHIDTNGDRELDPRELQCRLSDFGVQVRLGVRAHYLPETLVLRLGTFASRIKTSNFFSTASISTMTA